MPPGIRQPHSLKRAHSLDDQIAGHETNHLHEMQLQPEAQRISNAPLAACVAFRKTDLQLSAQTYTPLTFNLPQVLLERFIKLFMRPNLDKFDRQNNRFFHRSSKLVCNKILASIEAELVNPNPVKIAHFELPTLRIGTNQLNHILNHQLQRLMCLFNKLCKRPVEKTFTDHILD